MRRVGLYLACLLWASAIAWAGETQLVTSTASGEAANADVEYVSISGDGRYAVFSTAASNLTPGDTDGESDVYRKDLTTGEVLQVSAGPSGAQMWRRADCPGISYTGDFVTFQYYAEQYTPSAPATANPPLYVADCRTGDVSFAVATYGGISGPKITQDGRYVAFSSWSRTLIPGVNDGASHVYLLDRQSGSVSLVDTPSGGGLPNAGAADVVITPDGRFVAFYSLASNLIPNDTNEVSDVFVLDRQTGALERVSVTSAGEQTTGSPLTGGFGGTSEVPSISPDGRYVTFSSWANNLAPGAPETAPHSYIHDRQTGTTGLVDVSSEGEPGDQNSWGTAVSGSGRYVMFKSSANNLLPIPLAHEQVYVRDRETPSTDLLSLNNAGQPADLGTVAGVETSEDGFSVVFLSDSENLGPGTTVSLPSRGMPMRQGYRRLRGAFWDVGETYWASYAVGRCYAAGIVVGYQSDGGYHPTTPVKRDQMAVFLARALAGGEEAVPAGPDTPTFSDVAPDFWAYAHIEYVAAQKVAMGYASDGGYHPTATVTRGQMAAFLSRAVSPMEERPDLPSYTAPETPTFSDVSLTHGFYKPVEYAAAHGIARGYATEGKYHPEFACTRAQMAVFLQNAFRFGE